MHLAYIVVFCGLALAPAQESHTTVRHHRERVAEESSQLADAQTAIEKQDFSAARDLSLKYIAAHAEDFRGWYTLAYAESALNNTEAATGHYQKALALKPDFFEANLDLGLLFAKSHQTDSAITYLRKAVTETPNVPKAQEAAVKARAWTALGALLTGSESQQAYRQALALDPENADAKAGLARNTQPATASTSDITTADLESRVAAQPGDANAAALLGYRYLAEKQYAKAEPLLKQASEAAPQDANAHFRYGVALEHLQKNPEAETELLKAVKLAPNLGDAYGDLAIVAAANAHYPLSLNALDARAKFLPENPATYFLRATDLDHLQQFKPAAIMYRKFLAVSQGQLPNNEWQAKHRIIAIDPRGETKGKEQ